MPVNASSGRQSQSEVAAALAQTPAVAQVQKTAVNDAITPTSATGIAGLNLGTPRNGTQNSTKDKDTSTHKGRHPPTQDDTITDHPVETKVNPLYFESLILLSSAITLYFPKFSVSSFVNTLALICLTVLAFQLTRTI